MRTRSKDPHTTSALRDRAPFRLPWLRNSHTMAGARTPPVFTAPLRLPFFATAAAISTASLLSPCASTPRPVQGQHAMSNAKSDCRVQCKVSMPYSMQRQDAQVQCNVSMPSPAQRQDAPCPTLSQVQSQDAPCPMPSQHDLSNDITAGHVQATSTA
jgi:hypothetical protein